MTIEAGRETRMKAFASLLLLTAVLVGAADAQARQLKEYPTEAAAKKHCPKDEVVWSEVKGGGFYHVKGSRLYGRTPDGGYLCLKEAEQAGWKEYPKTRPE